MILPFLNTAPSRTSATRWGELTARPRVCADAMSLNAIATRAGAGARALGDSLAKPDGGEGGLDRVGGAQVDPVLGGVVAERQQHVEVVGDRGGRLGPLGAVVGGEHVGRGLGVILVLGVPDLGERLLRARLGRDSYRSRTA
jgi:hypothetical protein